MPPASVTLDPGSPASAGPPVAIRRLLLPLLFSLLSAACQAPASHPPLASGGRGLLATLRPGHPRLLALEEDLQRVRALVAQDRLAAGWRDRLRSEARRLLEEPPVARALIGPRLLEQSRRALDRIYTLALMYRLEGDRRFAERAREELLAISGFVDWNPPHFLDVAEMTHAAAIGYDWLYEFLRPADRLAVRDAIIRLGLRPSLDFYRKQHGWVVAQHNWNQVCNGGMVVGALAVADEEPGLAEEIIGQALKSVRRPLARYAPDGGWEEGPAYWNYATQYTVNLLAALESALGTDHGLSQAPGLAEAGMFRLYFTGPTGRSFNFADAAESERGAPFLFWLSRRFDRPIYAWMERRIGVRPRAQDLLWFDPRGDGPKAAGLPTDAVFRGAQVAFLRSAWEDPGAVFVAFKGGDNRANHSHLDLGTFVLDAEGVRWAMDLGPDDYDLPGYFSRARRFGYYRLGTAGHNTLTLDGANQRLDATAPIVAFSSRPDRAFAVADLTAGYADHARRVWRGIALLDRRHVLLRDEVEASAPVEILWGMHTRAEIRREGNRATLTQGGAVLHARILEPEGGWFDVLPAGSVPPESENPDVKRLIVRLPSRAAHGQIAVLFSPGQSAPPPASLTASAPLAAWVASARE